MLARRLEHFTRRFSDIASYSRPNILSLQSAHDAMSFYPRANAGKDAGSRRKGFSWKPFLIFTSLNALPVGALAFYLKQSIDDRRSEFEKMSDLLDISPEEAASRIEVLCGSSSNTMLLSGKTIVPIQPHLPESAPLILTSDDLVKNIDITIPGTSAVFDALSASRDKSQSSPFRNIHFGLSADCPIVDRIGSGEDRMVNIIYNGGLLGDASISVSGNAVIVEDERLRIFYWKDRWHGWIPKQKYVLVKMVPCSIKVYSLSGGEVYAKGIHLKRNGDTEWKR